MQRYNGTRRLVFIPYYRLHHIQKWCIVINIYQCNNHFGAISKRCWTSVFIIGSNKNLPLGEAIWFISIQGLKQYNIINYCIVPFDVNPYKNVDITFTYDNFTWKTSITYTEWPDIALVLLVLLLQLWSCEMHWLCGHVKYTSGREEIKSCLMPCECHSAKHNLLHFYY